MQNTTIITNTKVPVQNFIMNPEVYAELKPASKTKADEGIAKFDAYVKKALPEGHLIELSEDKFNGERKLVINHYNPEKTTIDSMRFTKLEFMQKSLYFNKNPILMFIDLIAENIKKARF